MVGSDATISDTIMPPSNNKVMIAASRARPPKITSPERLGAFCCAALPGGFDTIGMSDMGACRNCFRMPRGRMPDSVYCGVLRVTECPRVVRCDASDGLADD